MPISGSAADLFARSASLDVSPGRTQSNLPAISPHTEGNLSALTNRGAFSMTTSMRALMAAREATQDEGLTPDPWDARADFLGICTTELERIVRELAELRPLITQFGKEREKFNQRRVLAAARQREMEERLEHFSRQEIRSIYLEATESDKRAFMLSEQLERLTSKVQLYDRYAEHLRRTIASLQGRQESIASESGFPASSHTATGLPVARPGVPTGVAPTAAQPHPTATSWAANQSMQNSRQVLRVQEITRSLMAERLHSGAAQALANVVLTAEVVDKLLVANPAHAAEEMQRLKDMVKWSLNETRKLLFQLRPVQMADLDLADALQRYSKDVETLFEVSIIISGAETMPRLADDTRDQLFRIMQEAILNAAEHAHAQQIIVSCQVLPGQLILMVDDDGTGFDVEPALTSARQGHTLGLANIQQRADLVNGWLKIESSRGHGTHIELTVPV